MTQTPAQKEAERAEAIAQLEALAAIHARRLQILDQQAARYGVAVPANIVMEQSETREQLEAAQRRLRQLRPDQAERAPYVGLNAFQEDDGDLFFGREALVAELLRKVERSPFLAVMGASGSGKSSVVRAGLLPALRAGALPGSAQWRYVTIKPGATPVDSLAVALGKLQGGDLGAVLALSRQLAENDRALLLAAAMLLDGRADSRLVIVVDQAEELWTLAPTDPEQRKLFVEQQQRPFIRRVLDAATSAPPGGRTSVLTIITMRADFLHRAAEYRDLSNLISDHLQVVSPMAPDELRRAISGPAERIGCGFEAGLVDELAREVQGQPGALPLLQYTLLELWKQRRPDGTLTWEAFSRLGGVDGALAARADAILRERYASPVAQDELRRVLLRLVQPGEGAADTRRRAQLADLAPAGGSIDDVQDLLKPLADERLLTTGRDPATGTETIEVAHEALIRAWPIFGKWIGEARADLRLQLQLEEAAKEWLASDKRDEYLWSGLRLAQAEAWIERARPRLNERDAAFVAASQARVRAEAAAEEGERRERERLLEAQAAAEHKRAEAERRNASRLRTFLAIGGALLVAVVALAGFAWSKWNEADDAAKRADQARALAEYQSKAVRAQVLATNAEQIFPEQPLLALRVMLEALREVPEDAPARGSILQKARDLSRQGRVSLIGKETDLWPASADGRWLVLVDNQARGVLYHFTQGGAVAEREMLEGKVSGATFPSVGAATYFYIQYEDKPAELRRGDTGAVIAQLDVEKTSIGRFEGPSAAFLVTVISQGANSSVRLWRAATGQEVPLGDGASSVVFSLSSTAPYYAVIYANRTAELRSVADDQVIGPVSSGGVKNIYLGFGPMPSFIVAYEDRNPELWRDNTGAAITPLAGQLSQNTYSFFIPNPAALMLTVMYDDGTIELRRRDTGEIIPLPATPSSIQSSYDSAAGVVYIEYVDGTADLMDVVAGVTTRFAKKPLYSTLGMVLAEPYFAVIYPDHTAEIRSAANGKVMKSFDKGDVESVTRAGYGAGVSEYFIVKFRDNSGELWNMATGQKIMSVSGDEPDYYIEVSKSGLLPLLTIDRANRTKELWVLHDEPRQLPSMASTAGLRTLAVSEQYAIANIENDRFYLLDVAWLQALGGDSDRLSEAQLVDLACTPERAGGVDRAELQLQLDKVQIKQPAACM